MLTVLRRHLPVAFTCVVICTIFASGPDLARAAIDIVNADTVDGRDAVGVNASIDARKGKLVATSPSTGLLPNNIISKAPNADRLDGLDSNAFRVLGDGAGAGFVNIDGCGSGPLVSYAVHLARPTKLFGAATSTYGRSNPGPERPTMRIQLLDASNTVVAQTGRVSVDATSGNPSLTVDGLLFQPDGSTVFTAVAGDYTLRLWADNFGACTGFGQYQQPQLSHLQVSGN